MEGLYALVGYLVGFGPIVLVVGLYLLES